MTQLPNDPSNTGLWPANDISSADIDEHFLHFFKNYFPPFHIKKNKMLDSQAKPLLNGLDV
jgi:hypothetical protein